MSNTKGEFKRGDRVYHNQFQLIGVFFCYDADEDDCYVDFDKGDRFSGRRKVKSKSLRKVSD